MAFLWYLNDFNLPIFIFIFFPVEFYTNSEFKLRVHWLLQKALENKTQYSKDKNIKAAQNKLLFVTIFKVLLN